MAQGALSKVCERHLGQTSVGKDVQQESQEGRAHGPDVRNGRGPMSSDGVSALGRVMELQKRAHTGKRTPRRKREQDIDTEAAEARSNSRESGMSRGSSECMREDDTGTRLSPTQPLAETETRVASPSRPRRNSTGGCSNGVTTNVLPFELVKRPVRPLTVPLSSQEMDAPVHASTENELIVNKLEAIEERKDPDRHWAKITKYMAYASRGFGTFAPALGIGVYGIDLKKSIRRQAGSSKYTLWD